MVNDPAAGTAACTKKPPVRCTVAMTMLLAVTPAERHDLGLGTRRHGCHAAAVLELELAGSSQGDAADVVG